MTAMKGAVAAAAAAQGVTAAVTSSSRKGVGRGLRCVMRGVWNLKTHRHHSSSK